MVICGYSRLVGHGVIDASRSRDRTLRSRTRSRLRLRLRLKDHPNHQHHRHRLKNVNVNDDISRHPLCLLVYNTISSPRSLLFHLVVHRIASLNLHALTIAKTAFVSFIFVFWPINSFGFVSSSAFRTFVRDCSKFLSLYHLSGRRKTFVPQASRPHRIYVDVFYLFSFFFL